jgi:F-type H+-transporting ATPase subunit delta
MAEMLTIARPYAEAAFGVAQLERATLPTAYSQWLAALEALAAVAASENLKPLYANPQVSVDDLVSLFTGVVKDLTDSQRGLVRAMAENHRLAALPEVFRQFEHLFHVANAELAVEIHSAFDLSPSQIDSIVQTLHQKYGRKITATSSVDPALIGGVKIVIGDEVIDASVSGKLAKMSTALMN